MKIVPLLPKHIVMVNKVLLAIKKIIPTCRFLIIAIAIFLITYIYNTLYLSKNVIVLSHLGAEMISTIKLWLVLPGTLFFMLAYMKLSDNFSKVGLLHLVCWFCLAYYILFTLVIYPSRHSLTINLDKFILNFPALRYYFNMISYWYYALYYLFAELWAGIVFGVSFWSIVNSLTSVNEAKKFYPILTLIAQVGTLVSSNLAKIFVKYSANWQQMLNAITISITIAGLLLSLSIIILNRIIKKEILNSDVLQNTAYKNTDNFFAKIKHILSSRYIIFITLILLSYNVSYNLSESLWKKSVEIFFAGKDNQMYLFMADVTRYLAIFTIIASLISSYLIPLVGWRKSALIAPFVIIITGSIFMCFFMIYKSTPDLVILTLPILSLSVYVGAIHYIFSRSIKHSLFDPLKEIVFIPLHDELKTKGKAFVEIIGVRVGRGIGSFIQQALLMSFVSFSLLDLSPVIFIIFLICILCWLVFAKKLGHLMVKVK